METSAVTAHLDDGEYRISIVTVDKYSHCTYDECGHIAGQFCNFSETAICFKEKRLLNGFLSNSKWKWWFELGCVGIGPSLVTVETLNTVYVPIEARYPIEARPPFREQKLHANVYICNKMESLSNQNDI